MQDQIQILDADTVGKIAAGEVVESPSAVIKELIENAIDADATRIDVDIKDAGKTMIRVTDNGRGIVHTQFEKVFLPHATSKLETIEDLDRLLTHGFRGEALHSIAAVSRTTLISKPKQNLLGKKMICVATQIILEQEVGAQNGTTVIVEDLFFNTPARKKFMKSDQTERGRIVDMVTRLSLSHPQISFRLSQDAKPIFQTQGNGQLQSVIRSLYGKHVSEHMAPFRAELKEDIVLEGMVSKSDYFLNNRKQQSFFINHRYVYKTALGKALEDAYLHKIPIGKYPMYVLNLQISPSQVDVNIHPSKLEVKIEGEAELQELIFEKLSAFLLTQADMLLPQMKRRTQEKSEPKKQLGLFDAKHDDSTNRKAWVSSFRVDEEVDNETEKSDRTHDSETDLTDIMMLSSSDPMILNAERNADGQEERALVSEDSVFYFEDEALAGVQSEAGLEVKEPVAKEEEKTDTFDWGQLRVIGRVFECYILCASEDTFYIIDQHAAHERVRFEHYMADFKNRTVDAQMLLAPPVIRLNHHQMQLFEENGETLRTFGFEAERFGERDVVLRSAPVLFGVAQNELFFMEILDSLDDLRDLSDVNSVYQTIASKACKSAIRAQDRIEETEIHQLLTDLGRCQNPYTCPHGRPITVRMTRYELDKEFQRIQN